MNGIASIINQMENNPRERVVSPGTQTRTNEATITVLQQTLTHVYVC